MNCTCNDPEADDRQVEKRHARAKANFSSLICQLKTPKPLVYFSKFSIVDL
jgi:hypothetical protein